MAAIYKRASYVVNEKIKYFFCTASRDRIYSVDDCCCLLLRSSGPINFYLASFKFLSCCCCCCMCRCSNIKAAAVAISFQPKKVEPKPVFFFLKFRICRPRQDGRCTCLSNENLKWTELNWNRTTSFLLILL